MENYKKVFTKGGAIVTQNVYVYLINIRSITAIKLLELMKAVESETDENDIKLLCITETHERFDKVEIPKGYKCVVSRREMHDKKGGGLMVITNDDVQMKEENTYCSDVLEVDVTVSNEHFKLVLVYLARLENLGGWSPRLDFQLCLVSKIIGNGLQK